MLRLMLLSKGGHVRLKLFNELLLVAELLFYHLELLLVLLQVRVVLGRHLQFDVLLLKLLDLLVQIIELGLILLDLVLVLVDPLLILGRQLQLVFFELLDLPLPLIVALALKQLDLSLELLNHVILLLQLHVVEAFGGKIAAIVAINRRE